MGSYRFIVWPLAVIPSIVVIMIIWINPHLLSGGKDYDASFVLSLLGVALSYYGLIFSSYAALQVQALSDTYFFKARSPDLHKKLTRLRKSVSDFGSESSDDLRSQQFLSEASVAFRLAKRIKNRQVKKVAEQAEVSLKKLKIGMAAPRLQNTSAGQVPNYWEFHEKIAELLDELVEQLNDARVQA